MKIQRTVPPTAAPLAVADVLRGLRGLARPRSELRRLEEEFQEHFGVRHVFLVSSGKAALTLILRGLHSLRPARRRVTIPAYTCFSVPAAIVKAGLEISLCDIEPGTLAFDRAGLAGAVGADTLCVVPTHLFGMPTDLDWVCALGRERGAFVVEDAAQALGVKKDGRFMGTIGDVGFFSLGRGKNLTCGAGGAILTDDADIAGAIARQCPALGPPGRGRQAKEWIALLGMSVFIRPALYWLPSGLTFLGLGQTVYPEDFPVGALSGWQAGVLRGWRERLARDNDIRSENAAYFLKNLPWHPGRESGVPYLRLPILVGSREARDGLVAAHRRSGVGAMYPTPISEIAQLRGRFGGRAYPSATLVSQRLLTLPTHRLLAKRDLRRIVRALVPHAPRQALQARATTPC